MNRCVFLRGSRAVNRLTSISRTYATPSNDTKSEHWSISVVRELEQLVEQHIDESTDAVQELQDELSRASVPYKRRPLPLSPLMDPDLIAAREKWKRPKAPPSKTPTAFQLQLAKNPYAQALATPVRKCQITQHALPNFFLQDFNIIAHPETGDPFWLPRSLTAKVSKQSIQKPAPEPQEDDDGEEDGAFLSKIEREEMEATNEEETESLTEERPSTDASTTSRSKDTPKIGPNIYTLARQKALESMQERASGNESRWQKFGGPRMKMWRNYRKIRELARWRTDMDTFVLELMRRRTVESLVACVQLRRGYVIPCSGWEDAKAKPQAGAFLWTGLGEQEEVGEQEPPEFATVTIGKAKLRKVPVHNLRVLLGEEHLNELREKLPSLLDKGLLAVRHRGASIDLQLRLWRLQGYMAEFPDP